MCLECTAKAEDERVRGVGVLLQRVLNTRVWNFGHYSIGNLR